jgi:flagellar biosynthetic protein FlhB
LVCLRCAGPIVGTIVLAGLLAGAAQNRFHTTPEALAINWERINPVEGFKRVFSMGSVVPGLFACVRLVVILLLSYSAIKSVIADPIFHTTVDVAIVARFLAVSTGKIMMRIALVMAILAAADYGYQWWRTSRELMMTRDEVKEEARSTEGNPEIKAKRRRLRGRSGLQKMFADVPKADVVVTNPTHLAIALQYDRRTMKAPRILAKGSRLHAQRIREIARQHQVPVMENKPLARLLFKYGRVGGEVPAQLYVAVAEVLAWVYRLNRYRYYTAQNRVS